MFGKNSLSRSAPAPSSEGAEEVGNGLMLRHCANSGGRTQFAPTAIKPTLQCNSWDVEDAVPYDVC